MHGVQILYSVDSKPREETLQRKNTTWKEERRSSCFRRQDKPWSTPDQAQQHAPEMNAIETTQARA